ncbi:MAG: DUF2993 domain-containing protein [Leptolyngbya sp. Prado105]|jgi:hypothetical protein|nr:DUF2993 domain-containing protein [Leptolyngbya sp. Prado105]
MELFTILLSSLLGIISPTGVVVDRVAESQIRKQLVSAEHLQVRVDNAPSYQIVQGKVDRILIAGRGIIPVKGVRLERFELETDAIAVGLKNRKLTQPFQAGIRIVLAQEDINRALKSPLVTARLKNLSLQLLTRSQARQAERYDFLNPQFTLLSQNRAKFQIELQEQGDPAKLTIIAEAQPQIIAGRSLQLNGLRIWANGQESPKQITQAIENLIRDRLDLRRLEASNTTARILNLTLNSSYLDVASFVQIRPDVRKK